MKRITALQDVELWANVPSAPDEAEAPSPHFRSAPKRLLVRKGESVDVAFLTGVVRKYLRKGETIRVSDELVTAYTEAQKPLFADLLKVEDAVRP